MTARQLAARMGTTPSRIATIEKAEMTGGTTLRTLRAAAMAMNCSFVYAFVPYETLDAVVRERAESSARKTMPRLDHTMRLENRAVSGTDFDDELRRTVELILSGSMKTLWNEE